MLMPGVSAYFLRYNYDFSLYVINANMMVVWSGRPLTLAGSARVCRPPQKGYYLNNLLCLPCAEEACCVALLEDPGVHTVFSRQVRYATSWGYSKLRPIENRLSQHLH